ncbi:hypothetical protein [Paenarthrobacter sp. C1]|uniref:hypothetical protein n=1 Tax=Paenarthrobacter sp. C1 TaxID=3400220 RepID=UPI003BF5A667
MTLSAMTNWPPALLDLPDTPEVWDTTGIRPRARLRVNGIELTLQALEVSNDTDNSGFTYQVATDEQAEEHLLELYNPEAAFETWSGFGKTYALFATPTNPDDIPATRMFVADLTLDRATWSGQMPEFEEHDRKTVTVVARGHCGLHLEARRVDGPDQEFVEYPEDRAHLAALAGWDGPYPTLDLDGAQYVVLVVPFGD